MELREAVVTVKEHIAEDNTFWGEEDTKVIALKTLIALAETVIALDESCPKDK